MMIKKIDENSFEFNSKLINILFNDLGNEIQSNCPKGSRSGFIEKLYEIFYPISKKKLFTKAEICNFYLKLHYFLLLNRGFQICFEKTLHYNLHVKPKVVWQECGKI